MIKKNHSGIHSEAFDYLCSKYVFRNNVVAGYLEFSKIGKITQRKVEYGPWKMFDDRTMDTILIDIHEKNLKHTKSSLESFINSITVSPDFDPFLEYFNELPEWNGTDYIDELTKTITVKNPEFFKKIFKKFLVATVAGLIFENQSNDTCLILKSNQGDGKSRWMRNMIPKHLSDTYFYEGPIDTGNKEHSELLSANWFINLDELDSLNKNKIDALKSFVTRQRIMHRKTWGHYNTKFTRRTSFLGTTNKSDFLTDLTGSRRWLVFDVLKIDYNHDVNLDGLWSQCYHLLVNEKMRYWFNIQEIQEINERNELFRERSKEEIFLIENFEFINENISKGEYMSSLMVLNKLASCYPKTSMNLNSLKMGRILSKFSQNNKKVNGINQYKLNFIGIEPGLTPIDTDAVNTTMPNQSYTVNPVQQDINFNQKGSQESINEDDLPF